MFHLLFSLLALFVSLTTCHNILVSPAPWNPTPIKAAPCGGGVSLTVPQAIWHAGSIEGIEWDVIGDGIGSLNISIDPTGGTNFDQVIVSNTGTAELGLNSFNFSVPNVTCTGINSTCSIQVFSTSGWVACTSVNILPSPCVNCTPEAPPGPTCQTVVGLNFCSQYNNTKVSIGAGFTAQSLDLMVNESLYEYSYLMPTFLMNGTTAACQQIFKEYLCALVFPACDGDAQACVSTCTHFKQSCGLNPSHDALYNCDDLDSCSSSSTDQYIIIFAGVGIVVVIVVAFILNFIVRRRYQAGYTAIQ